MIIFYLICSLICLLMLLQNTYDDVHRIPGKVRFWFAVWGVIPVLNVLFILLVVWQMVRIVCGNNNANNS